MNYNDPTNYNPEREPHLVTTYNDGKVTTKRKGLKPHYKEMYESALRELDSQRKFDRFYFALSIAGWIGFVIMIAIFLVDKFQ